jgi:hypothetical protein
VTGAPNAEDPSLFARAVVAKHPDLHPERVAVVAALHELAAFFAEHPEYPSPTDVTLWTHDHDGSVADVDLFVAAAQGAAQRNRDEQATVYELLPQSGLNVRYTYNVYPAPRLRRTGRPGSNRT